MKDKRYLFPNKMGTDGKHVTGLFFTQDGYNFHEVYSGSSVYEIYLVDESYNNILKVGDYDYMKGTLSIEIDDEDIVEINTFTVLVPLRINLLAAINSWYRKISEIFIYNKDIELKGVEERHFQTTTLNKIVNNMYINKKFKTDGIVYFNIYQIIR